MTTTEEPQPDVDPLDEAERYLIMAISNRGGVAALPNADDTTVSSAGVFDASAHVTDLQEALAIVRKAKRSSK